MNPSFDVIVIGLGGMGSAAAWHLARRGHRVLGLEQFALGHDQGSSHGQTRIIRQAYYEHPSYVPLVQRAYEGWHDLEQVQGIHLLTSCPCLSIGSKDSELIEGVHRSARAHGLAINPLTRDEIQQRWPVFNLCDETLTGLVEHSAGFLYVDACVRAMAQEARRLGAELHDQEAVRSWRIVGAGVEVETAKGIYRAGRLVLAAGPWAAMLLGQYGAMLRVMRQVVFWFPGRDASLFRRDRFPIFIMDTPEGYFYGLPAVDGCGLKVAKHYGAAELMSPEEVTRQIDDRDEQPVRDFVAKYLPAASGPTKRASVCLYTLTPDRHFIVDVHPEHRQVVVAAGFSGHGFKFAPVVGEILADLVEGGSTERPAALFGLERFAGVR